MQVKQPEIRACCSDIFVEMKGSTTPGNRAVALYELTMLRADRAQDYIWTRRGGLCVYVIDAWCSNTVAVDGRVSKTSHFLYKNGNHIIVTISLLFTYTPMLIKKNAGRRLQMYILWYGPVLHNDKQITGSFDLFHSISVLF